MNPNQFPAQPLDYATDAHPFDGCKWLASRRSVLSTLIPIPLLILLLFSSHYWPRWFHIGQAYERICGIAWIATAAFSIFCSIVLMFRRKRGYVVLTLALHVVFILLTVLPPGCEILIWLMHWATGPGA